MPTVPQFAARRNGENFRYASAVASPFRRDLLPVPSIFYERELPKLSRPSRGWVKALCPFHPDKNPSLNVNLSTGGFLCFACQAKGGSVIDFLMQRDGLDFKSAALALGAWEHRTSSRAARADVRRRMADRARQARAVDDLIAAEKSLRMRYRGAIHTLEADQRQTAERLHDASITIAEAEECWAQLQASFHELRRALAAYYLLNFGAVADRVEFIQHPDQRDAAIQNVLWRGLVRDDNGRVFEVVMP